METNTNSARESREYGIGELLGRAVDGALPVVRGIPDGALAGRTPCAEYDVKALVNHLFHVIVEFRKLAAKGSVDFTRTPDRVGEGADWRERFTQAAQALVAAWSVPGAEEGTAGTMNMPARTLGSMALLDVTVHGWELARATGQREPSADPAVVAELAGQVAGLAPTARAMGMFGEPVAVVQGAPEFERLLGVTGRDPGWKA
ncbi:TIGR03086 family metal-binding protein [Streptomyces sp. NPDC058683]|uniref:TIGR03086 family metal-binding protein n=1 Tax=Streptomyces sp. NPDC058683 TaxID=3346597 RepID=UPI0036691EC0